MCMRCLAHNRRYLIQDRQTGLIMCEECGYAVCELTETAYQNGRYIWEANPAWPHFSSFEDLMDQILTADDILLPPCSLIAQVPSRLLTRIFDILNDRSTPNIPNGASIH
jgi:hypothetical protein